MDSEYRMGMNEVYSLPPERNPVANVVLVHGLFGGPWKTWAVKSHGSGNGRVFWPQSLLPSVVDNVNVHSFGYDADVEKFMSAAGLNTVHQHGRNLFNELHALRNLPTIIIAHSLGGLVVKEALNQAASSAQPDEREVVSNTKGIIFLGTPHRGSNAASYGRMAYLLTKAFAFQSANTKLLTALEKNSETLDRISTAFFQTLESYQNLRIASFSEEKQVRFGVVGMQIVRPDSAKIGHAQETWGSISEDHRNMAKYSSLKDDGFVKVKRKIQEWVHDIETKISSISRKSYEDCLQSLNDPVARFRVKEVDTVRHYNKNTFEWLFTDVVPFSRWLRDDSGEFDPVFWITGKPGSGKSTLMRFALEDSRTMSLQPSNSESQPMAYFFHLRGKSLVQKSLRGMLMELLYQILETYHHCFELIRPIFLRLKHKEDWDIRSLSEAMLQIPHFPPATPGSRDRITLFVDALDENQNQDDNRTLLGIFDNLIDTYRRVSDRPGTPVLKICLASRSWPIFQKRLGHDPRIPSFAIDNFTMKDIQDYTRSRLLKTIRIEWSEQRQTMISQLSSGIASRAMGVFIWVRVVVDNLYQDIIDGTPIESLQRKLKEYPEELDSMYKLTLNRVRKGYRPEALAIFKVVFASHVPLDPFQLYTVTQICMGSPPSDDKHFKYPEDLFSWLASRSGGLIAIVNAGIVEEKPVSVSWTKVNLHLEFIHQTVQDFVRKSLDESLEMTQEDTWMSGVSGSRLLALACLDKHPPHFALRNVAKDIFSYIRDVEHEEDQSNGQQQALPPHWDAYDLHDFPFRLRGPKHASGFPTGAMLSHYLDSDEPLVHRIIDNASQFQVNFHLKHTNSPNVSAFMVVVLQNLYRTTLPAHLSTLAPESGHRIYRLLLYTASVGPRLSAEGLDRLRMFHHIRTSYTVMPRMSRPDSSHDRELEDSFFQIEWEAFRPVNELIEHVCGAPPGLAATFAALTPSAELDDDTLLAFAHALDGNEYTGYITVEIPARSGGSLKARARPRLVELPLSAFCSRFRDTNRAKWVRLFSGGDTQYVDVLGDGLVVDHALFDALGERPPILNYTAGHAGTAEAIAWACFPAAWIAVGHGPISKAFFRCPAGNMYPGLREGTWRHSETLE